MTSSKNTKTSGTPSPDEIPTTLAQAHEVLSKLWPGRNATLSAWQSYYAHSAYIYAEVAEIDRYHHHEALYWATRERQKADHYATRIAEAKVAKNTP